MSSLPPPGYRPGVRRPVRLLAVFFLLFFSTGVFAQFPDINLQQPAGTNIPDNGTIAFGSVSVGSSVTKTVTIQNKGELTLGNFALSKSGVGQADYTYSSVAGASVAPGGSTTFTITFTPSTSGSRVAKVLLANNDPIENPYDINVSGFGTVPEIAVSQGGTGLTDGGSTVNFGRVNTGTTVNRVFVVRNTGTGTLSNLSAQVTGGTFSTAGLSVTSLATGGSANLTVSFSPSSDTAYSGTLRIYSNDADENPFDITLGGNGNIPFLDVEQPAGTPLINGASIVDFGTVPAGQTTPLEFTIRNVGVNNLTGLTVTKGGENPGEFPVQTLSATTLAPGATLTFTTSFAPTGVGARSAVISVGSSQTPAAFDITLTGTAGSPGDEGDSDGDGVPNLVEYATGTDLLAPNEAPGELTLEGENLKFTLNRLNEALQSVSYFVEYTDNPSSGEWASVGEFAVSLVSNDGTLQRVAYTLPAGTTGRRFVRLRVTRN